MACQVAIDEMRRAGFPDGHPAGGRCASCRWCERPVLSDALTPHQRAAMECVGVCVEGGATIVDLAEEHSWDECWTEVA